MGNMGKLQEFDITFKDNKVVYSPGDAVSGTLKITTAQALLFKDIKVNCQGFCGVTSKIGDTDWTVEEQYFSSTLSVADKGTLKQGDHIFPFKFLIPASIPTSFEGNYGKIMYRVRAFIDTSRFSKDYKTEKPFYLLSLLNLNDVPDIHGPSSSSVTKTFTYLLGAKTGTVVLKAQSDMKGYTPGQVIKLTTEIDNRSGKTTGTVVARLIQKVTYQTKKPTIDLRTLVQVEGTGVKADKQAEWKEQIIVPPLRQSSMADCGLINMEYFIQPAKLEHSSRYEPSSHNQGPRTTAPRPARRPAPKPVPRMRVSTSSPSAPPAEMDYLANSMPTLYPLLPPEYSTSTLPHEAPPSYVESCISNT
ncbi:arrestin domain-containing protein 1 isoform X2 [Oncorhynchus mykiss]|uniref:arrestin domain-containing protein 1 isoform X2 n=1 Tax=Oncorhynchus mykiss TaxID=8022 RepID=UPI001877BF22|nr:arrestin domain-containing protein 1 isoform X2 [Oncorhynchus mykiss]